MKRFFSKLAMKNCLFILYCFFLQIGFGQGIKGFVYEEGTNEPIAGVSMMLLPTGQQTTTAKDGAYTFSSVKSGEYSVRIVSDRYASSTYKVTIQNDNQTVLDIYVPLATIRLHKEVVVSAQRFPSEQFNSPEAITVLDNTKLAEYAPGTTPDLFMGATGVWMQKTNYGGGSPFIRGLTGQQTLLMVDGIRLNNATFRYGPNQYLNTIDPFSLQQIEVIRGSGSVKYGTDALGGVINLLTKTPRFSSDGLKISGSVFTKYLSQSMERSLAGELSIAKQNVAVMGNFALRNFGDAVAGGGIKQTPTGYNQLSGDIKMISRLTDRQLLTLAYQKMDQNNVPVFHKLQLEDFAENQFTEQDRSLAYARWETFVQKKSISSFQVTASWQGTNEVRDSRRNGSTLRINEADQVNSFGLSALVNSNFSTSWQAVSGVEWYFDHVASSRLAINTTDGSSIRQRALYPDGATMNNLGVFTHHTVSLHKFSFSGGVRLNRFDVHVDESSGYFDRFTLSPVALIGNFSTVYTVNSQHNIIASINTGLRSPNIDDLGSLGIRDFRYEIPNKNLVPEKSITLELGYKVQTEQLAGSVAVFRSYLTNIIVRRRQGSDSIQGFPVHLKENISNAFIQGVETALEWRITTGFYLRNNFTYIYGQNESANEPYRRIPPLSSLTGFTYRVKNYWLNLDYVMAAKQDRLAKGDVDDNRIPDGGTPCWQVVNMNVGASILSRFRVSGGVQNLFDTLYRTHGSGVDGYGRSYWISLFITLP